MRKYLCGALVLELEYFSFIGKSKGIVRSVNGSGSICTMSHTRLFVWRDLWWQPISFGIWCELKCFATGNQLALLNNWNASMMDIICYGKLEQSLILIESICKWTRELRNFRREISWFALNAFFSRWFQFLRGKMHHKTS